jgi:anti-anti-sigma regulatory factor
MVVAPSGVLGSAEAERLRRVLRSREGAYSQLVIDLRELVSIDAEGVRVLLGLQKRAGDGVAFVAGAVARTALEGGGLTLYEDVDALLAPHRDGDT